MPTYGVFCEKCDNRWEVFRPIKDRRKLGSCPKCKSRKTKQYFGNTKGLFVFEKRFFEHLSPEGVFIESKKQLREECKARGFDTERVPALN